MIENGVYIIKEEFFERFKRENNCIFKYNKNESRPVFCCIRDKEYKQLFWAIPTSKINKDKNIDRIKRYINMPKSNICSSFYHIGKTNFPCIFCISSVFPVIDKYIEREYIVNNKHLILNNNKQNREIKNKLIKILSIENSNPNRFEQKITYIKNKLMEEIKSMEK